MDVGEDVLRATAACVAKRRASGGELEVRLGRFVEGRFIAGVERDDFDELLKDFVSCGLTDNGGWTEIVDYFYVTQDRTQARTRVRFDSQKMCVDTEHVHKHAVHSELLKQSEDGRCVRVSLCDETPIHTPPDVCVPTRVRIQQRRTFDDVRGTSVVWRYEISRTWSAASRSAVEHQQHMNPPTYEVECELVDEDGSYLSSHDDVAIAKSLLLKTRLLLGEADASALALHQPEHVQKKRRSNRVCQNVAGGLAEDRAS